MKQTKYGIKGGSLPETQQGQISSGIIKEQKIGAIMPVSSGESKWGSLGKLFDTAVNVKTFNNKIEEQERLLKDKQAKKEYDRLKPINELAGKTEGMGFSNKIKSILNSGNFNDKEKLAHLTKSSGEELSTLTQEYNEGKITKEHYTAATSKITTELGQLEEDLRKNIAIKAQEDIDNTQSNVILHELNSGENLPFNKIIQRFKSTNPNISHKDVEKKAYNLIKTNLTKQVSITSDIDDMVDKYMPEGMLMKNGLSYDDDAVFLKQKQDLKKILEDKQTQIQNEAEENHKAEMENNYKTTLDILYNPNEDPVDTKDYIVEMKSWYTKKEYKALLKEADDLIANKGFAETTDDDEFFSIKNKIATGEVSDWKDIAKYKNKLSRKDYRDLNSQLITKNNSMSSEQRSLQQFNSKSLTEVKKNAKALFGEQTGFGFFTDDKSKQKYATYTKAMNIWVADYINNNEGKYPSVKEMHKESEDLIKSIRVEEIAKEQKELGKQKKEEEVMKKEIQKQEQVKSSEVLGLTTLKRGIREGKYTEDDIKNILPQLNETDREDVQEFLGKKTTSRDKEIEINNKVELEDEGYIETNTFSKDNVDIDKIKEIQDDKYRNEIIDRVLKTHYQKRIELSEEDIARLEKLIK